MNELDNATSAKAVDALLSYETVTIFNNQALEIAQVRKVLGKQRVLFMQS